MPVRGQDEGGNDAVEHVGAGADITFQKLKTAVTSVPDSTLIINCDDVLSYTLAAESKNAYVTYGISEQIFDDISRSMV